MPTALHELTAAQAVRAIDAGHISPVELVEALLARAVAVDDRVLAWERLDAEGALAAARAAEARWRNGSPLRPLHGVPIGVKDIFDTAGLRTAAGFAPYDGRVPAADAALVAALRASGAIVLGKTVNTQFAFTDPARTRNPWSAERTPGGSSSGSGAGVAAREMPMALGSQTAGSTLRPAAYCGAVGFKPTFGRISLKRAFPLAWSLDHAGVIARSVEDCGLFLIAAEGPPSNQIVNLPLPNAARGAEHGPQLAVLRDCLDHAEPLLQEHVRATADRLGRAGAAVREARLTRPLDLVLAVHRVIMTCEASATYAPLLERHPDHFGPILRATVQTGRLVPATAYLQAQRLRRACTAALREALVDVDALLLPTATNVAPGMETTGDPSLQVPATLAGFPSISLLSGLTSDGLPLAIQLIGAPGEDERLLDVAAWCEAQLGPMPAPPL